MNLKNDEELYKLIIYFSDDNSKSDGVGGLIKESLDKGRRDSSPLASVRKQVILKDDPDCPNLFKLEKLKKKSDPGLFSYFDNYLQIVFQKLLSSMKIYYINKNPKWVGTRKC